MSPFGRNASADGQKRPLIGVTRKRCPLPPRTCGVSASVSGPSPLPPPCWALLTAMNRITVSVTNDQGERLSMNRLLIVDLRKARVYLLQMSGIFETDHCH